MQAIARVNRVFRDKPGGLVVDYLGLANNLKSALRSYMRDSATGTAPIENESSTSTNSSPRCWRSWSCAARPSMVSTTAYS